MFIYKILFPFYQYVLLLWSKVSPLFLKPKPKAKSVLYLAAFFPENAGYHWRVQKWADVLREKGYKVDIAVANSKELLQTYNANTYRFLISFMRTRFRQVLIARKYETVIVRRELLLFNEYGNHFLEKLLRKMCANVILDIDDDLSAAKRQPHAVTSLFGKILLEDGNSFRNSFQYYDRFFVASNYLKAYVQKHGGVEESRIEVIPTCVDYDRYPAKVYKSENLFTLGWIGSDGNYPLLISLFPILDELYKQYGFQLNVVGGNPINIPTNFPIHFIPWSLETEVEAILTMDVGLMPLIDNEEAKGKGGFKLIQYMGLGVVGCATGITINNEIVDDNVNSFLVINESEWYAVLSSILENRGELSKIGLSARKKVLAQYSYIANEEKYLKLIQNYNNKENNNYCTFTGEKIKH